MDVCLHLHFCHRGLGTSWKRLQLRLTKVFLVHHQPCSFFKETLSLSASKRSENSCRFSAFKGFMAAFVALQQRLGASQRIRSLGQRSMIALVFASIVLMPFSARIQPPRFTLSPAWPLMGGTFWLSGFCWARHLDTSLFPQGVLQSLSGSASIAMRFEFIARSLKTPGFAFFYCCENHMYPQHYEPTQFYCRPNA